MRRLQARGRMLRRCVLVACLLAACSDSDKPAGEAAGTGGAQAGSSAGSGAPGTGGTSAISMDGGAGNGGAGGNAAGNGGSGGAGGNAAGNGGSGGAGGNAAGNGGSGGAGGSTAGSGGSGGSGGAGGDAGGSGGASGGLDAGMDASSCTGKLNVLFMFDESLSMEELWGTTTRLQAAREAVSTVVSAYASTLTTAALFFPAADCIQDIVRPDGGAVLPLSDPMQIDFRNGNDFLDAWDDHLVALPNALRIGTPLDEAFDRADIALSTTSLSGATRVILITDGEGNCVADPDNTGIPTALPVYRVVDWAAAGIEAHLIALPNTGMTQLEMIAMNAGTQLLQPADPAALTSLLDDLLSAAVCP